MYIIFSIIALALAALSIYIDDVLFKKTSLKFTLVVKSFVLIIFDLLIMAANKSFSSGKIGDFTGSEWLYLVIVGILFVVAFVVHHMAIKDNEKHVVTNFETSTLLGFINIFFIIFSRSSILGHDRAANIVFFVIGMVAIVANIILQLFVFNKDVDKGSLIFVALCALAFAGIVISKKQLLIRQSYEVILFYGTILCFITSLVLFLLDKEEINKFKSYSWQEYLLAVASGAIYGVIYLLEYKALKEPDATSVAINITIGSLFIVFEVIKIASDCKKKQSIKANIGNIIISSLLIVALIGYGLSVSL